MKIESELRLSFDDLQQIFLEKYPNGKIEKDAGTVKVWFESKHKNSYYKYNGTLLEISEKLKLEINNKYTTYNPVTPIITDRKTGKITVSANDMGYSGNEMEVNYIIENGKITLMHGRKAKELKIYEAKKGYYFNLNAKRYNIEL